MQSATSNHAVFSVLDPRLPMLAAKAALQIDRCRIARKAPSVAFDLDAVKELGQLLQSATIASTGYSKSLIDPPSIAVLSQAIGSYEGGFRESSEKLAEGLTDLANQLTTETLSTCDEQALVAVREFFVALSNLSATGQQSRFKSQPSSQLRK